VVLFKEDRRVRGSVEVLSQDCTRLMASRAGCKDYEISDLMIAA